RAGETSRTLGERAEAISRVFEQADEKLAARAESSARTLLERSGGIVRAFQEADERIVQRTQETSSELAKRAEQIAATLSDVEKRLGDGAESIVNKVGGQIQTAEERLAGSAERIGEKLVEQVSKTETQLVSRANVIAETFSAVNQHIGQRTEEAAKTLDERTRELNDLLASRSADIARIIDEKARPLIESFEESGGELQKSLETATQKATERLRSENTALVNAIASRTAESLSAMEGARETLAGKVNELLDRLAHSSSRLGELIEGATGNLGAVDERLTGATQNFAASTEKAAQTFASSARMLDTNVGRLSDLSSQTLNEIAGIASRFDEHSKLLAQAQDLIGSAQSNLTSTLEDRQKALEELAVGLVKKSEDIEGLMRSFENVVGDAIERAEGRTIATTDQIRNAISEVIDAATARFADATQEIRGTAGAIRAELEETRSELKRGVLEMPEEAKESTSAIRRAVSEQIAALKELADIVAKSGRMYDVSDSAVQPDDTPTTRPAETARRPVEAAPQPVRVPRPAPAPAAQSRVREAVDEPALRGSIGPSEAETAGRNDTDFAQEGGWVKNLLRRASQEEEAPAPASRAAAPRSALHVVESLNSLSVDIARAIDHEASVELWQRYRRGERNVFTRRLYTLKGQQTFDEIRRKYQVDGEFRAAVDRYCEDFEKLLQDVSRNDRDNMVSETYLTSDTGKVYTMLAHASGRLR
ncbi:MAG: kinesin, partial [Nitratireductor sp.]